MEAATCGESGAATGILGGAAAGANGTAGGLRLRADDTLRFLCELPYAGGGVEPERTHGCAAFAPAVFLSVSREGLDSTGSWEALVVLRGTDGPANVLEDVCSKEESAPVTGGAAHALTSFANGLPSMASSVAVRHALIDRRSSSRESCDLSDGSTSAAAVEARVGAAEASAATNESKLVARRGAAEEEGSEEEEEEEQEEETQSMVGD